jgi:hypothetical protein
MPFDDDGGGDINNNNNNNITHPLCQCVGK